MYRPIKKANTNALRRTTKSNTSDARSSPYPEDITLLSEIGNDDVKMKTWLVPGKKGIIGTITRRITLKELSCVKMDSGIYLIAVKGEIHELK